MSRVNKKKKKTSKTPSQINFSLIKDLRRNSVIRVSVNWKRSMMHSGCGTRITVGRKRFTDRIIFQPPTEGIRWRFISSIKTPLYRRRKIDIRLHGPRLRRFVPCRFQNGPPPAGGRRTRDATSRSHVNKIHFPDARNYYRGEGE